MSIMVQQKDEGRKHFVVIVLGDVGRSPRMQYHALSLLEHGHNVSLIGYSGEGLIPQLQRYNETLPLDVIRFQPFVPPSHIRRVLLPLYFILRLVGLIFGLCRALTLIRTNKNPIDCIIVQNPPSIPLLLIAYIFTIMQSTLSRENRPGLVIDWHNLGYTMFQTSSNHPIQKMAKLYEKLISPLAKGNLCVTNAMREWLIDNFHIQSDRISVLYDRPPGFFHPTTVEEMHDIMSRLEGEFEKQLTPSIVQSLKLNNDPNSTWMTKISTINGSKQIIARSDRQRPALVISSTSWTPDEDFSILLDALVKFDLMVTRNEDDELFPNHVVVIVTGKGPQKQMYQEQIASMNIKHVSILTAWLESSDYPLLLGCADLGVSLHTSTSGLDLPMKVLDMFGCEVPVCAVNFPCLEELVQDGVNGCIFGTHESEVLANQLYRLLNNDRSSDDSGKIGGDLELFRNNIRGMVRWRENWKEQAHDIILSSCPRPYSDEQNKKKK